MTVRDRIQTFLDEVESEADIAGAIVIVQHDDPGGTLSKMVAEMQTGAIAYASLLLQKDALREDED